MAIDFKWLKGILFQTANVHVAKTKNQKDVWNTPVPKTGSELDFFKKNFVQLRHLTNETRISDFF